MLWVRIPLPLYIAHLVRSVKKFLANLISQNILLTTFIKTFIVWCLYVFNIKPCTKAEDLNFFYFEKDIDYSNIFFDILDYIFYRKYFFSNFFKKHSQTKLTSVKVDCIYNNKFYKVDNNKNIDNTQLFLYGLKMVWKHLRFWILPVVVLFLFAYYSFFLRSLPFSKVIFGYLLVANFIYLFLSGFVFFFKKYQYRLYTSAIQRFWRRSLIIFWIIEGCLFMIFFYLIMNANQEPVHMYDNVQIYKTHMYSWRYFIPKVISSAFLVALCYMLLLSLKWNTFTKTNNYILLVTVILLYVVWLEFYQLFHIMNCYGNTNWVYDFSEHLWSVELEFKRTRIVNHYVTIALIAKFWHVVFAAVFWIFFILRGLESSRTRYPLLSANLQNFLIVYVMSWLYMYPWFKWVMRRGLDMPYFWFFINNRKFGMFILFNDIKLYAFGFLDCVVDFFDRIYSFWRNSFYYWHGTSKSVGSTQFRKQNIRDVFISKIQ